MWDKSNSHIKFILCSKYTTIDYSLNLLNLHHFDTEKIGFICHDSSESSIDFYFIFCSCSNFEEAKKTCILLGKKENLYGILNNEHQKDACSLGENCDKPRAY